MFYTQVRAARTCICAHVRVRMRNDSARKGGRVVEFRVRLRSVRGVLVLPECVRVVRTYVQNSLPTTISCEGMLYLNDVLVFFTRCSMTLSSDVNLPHVIDLRDLCGAVPSKLLPKIQGE